MTAAAPILSVVVPTRNRPETLVRCLDRLAPGAQSLDASQYEVIVADDGGAAETRALLSRAYPWARHVTGPQRGPASNRNAGARATTGEWLVFTDDDTLPDRDWLGTIAAASDGVDVVEGRTVCRAGLRSPREHAPVNERGGYWWSCNIAVRRTAFDALGGFDERFRVPHMEDVDLRERALAAKVPWRFAPDAVVDHPPRREPWGTAWGRVHAAEVLFSTIHHRPFRLGRRLIDVTRVRWRSIMRAPFSRDGASAALSWMVELVDIVWCWRGWWRALR